MSEIKEVLTAVLNALDRLLRLFRIERILHLVIGIIAFLLLIFAIVLLLISKEVTITLLVSLFSSSGLITISSARITYFFNKGFKLIEHVTRVLIESGRTHERQ